MAAPEDFGAIATIVGGIGAGGWALMKMFQQFSGIRADVANSNSYTSMLDEQKDEIKDMRARLDAKDLLISQLTQEKFTYQADLKSALDKITLLTTQVSDLKDQLTEIKNAMKGGTQ